MLDRAQFKSLINKVKCIIQYNGTMTNFYSIDEFQLIIVHTYTNACCKLRLYVYIKM